MGWFSKIKDKVVGAVRDAGRFARRNAGVIGTAVGTVVGGPGGAAIGGQLGGIVTGLFDSSVPQISQPAPAVMPPTTVGINGGMSGYNVSIPTWDNGKSGTIKVDVGSGQNGGNGSSNYLGGSSNNLAPILFGLVTIGLLSD